MFFKPEYYKYQTINGVCFGNDYVRPPNCRRFLSLGIYNEWLVQLFYITHRLSYLRQYIFFSSPVHKPLPVSCSSGVLYSGSYTIVSLLRTFLLFILTNNWLSVFIIIVFIVAVNQGLSLLACSILKNSNSSRLLGTFQNLSSPAGHFKYFWCRILSVRATRLVHCSLLQWSYL